MISDITLGQFFPGFSPLHKLDPRTKIILAILFITAVFLVNNPLAFLFIILLTVFMVAVSRISFTVVLRGIKPIIFILIFTSLINLFMTVGDGEPLLKFWFFKIYKEGIIRAVFMSLRVIVLIVGTSMLLTYTTSPISLTDGIESLLKPLKKIGVPVHVFAMMMTIALRFIPTLMDETDKIMSAQKARGANFETGSLVKRAKALIPILIPLFVSSFRRADDLATAMECRCYHGGEGRTKMTVSHFHASDFWAMIITVAFGAGIVLVNIYGFGYSM